MTQAFDIHSLIISSLQHEEPMYTADEVIDEIEGMMEDSDDDEVRIYEGDVIGST